MKRVVIASFAAAILAPTGLAGQPSIARQYGEWTMMGHEDPMDGWTYIVTNDLVPPLTRMAFPYQNAVMSVSLGCNAGAEHSLTAMIFLDNAPRIGNLRRWDPPRSWYREEMQRERRSPGTLAKRQETQLLLERRVLVRVRWNDEPPAEIGAYFKEGRTFLGLFIDPLGVTGEAQDNAALSAFVADLSRHSRLLVEIPWADPRLPRSHFRIPLDGAAAAIEDAERRCANLQGG